MLTKGTALDTIRSSSPMPSEPEAKVASLEVGASSKGCDSRPIQVSVAMPGASPARTADQNALIEHLLSVPFIWSVFCVVVGLVCWKDLRRLLRALITLLERSDKVSFGGASIENTKPEPDIYTIILDDDRNRNGVDME